MKKKSSNTDDYKTLLKNAMKNPGIREVEKLYEDYRGISRQADMINSKMDPGYHIITSDSSS